MKGYLKILGLMQSTLILFGIFFVGSLSAQTRSLIIWSQQESENTTHNGAIAYSPDGQLVASGRADSNDISIWKAVDGSLVRTLNGQNNNANVLAFSPDSQYLVSGTGGGGQGLSLNLWRVADGARLVGRIGAFTNGTIGLSFSPDGQLLAASGFHANFYKIYHIPDMTLVGTFGNFDPVLGYDARIFSVAFSRDGQLIAVGATRGIYLRRASDGSLVRIINPNYPNPMTTLSIAFSPDRSSVAGGVAYKDSTYSNCIDCSIKLFRIDDGALLHTYTDPSGPDFPKIEFSPNGRIIAAGYSDNNGTITSGAAQFWNVATEESIRRDARDFWVQDFAYSPSGKFYAFFGADGVIAVARAPFLRGITRDEDLPATK
jgi:WD40 repeat protein